MNKKDNLELLPINFRHEKEFFLKTSLDNWSQISKLRDSDISFIVNKNPLCTESRLKKIRAISIFISELEIKPTHAYLLLHCGVGSIKALSNIEPHVIEKRIGRLERSLNVKTTDPASLILLKEWIKKAKNILKE
tara:strand:- start:703 stop:1107 length:405 start_codon:yes stop_codon:yes gene_type:complete